MGKVFVFSDGACLTSVRRADGRVSNGRVGPGGYASVVVTEDGSCPNLITGFVEGRSIFYIEMLALVVGIEATPRGSEVVVFTDQKYVVHFMKRFYRRRHRSCPSGWDKELYDRFVRLCRRRDVSFVYHSVRRCNSGKCVYGEGCFFTFCHHIARAQMYRMDIESVLEYRGWYDLVGD